MRRALETGAPLSSLTEQQGISTIPGPFFRPIYELRNRSSKRASAGNVEGFQPVAGECEPVPPPDARVFSLRTEQHGNCRPTYAGAEDCTMPDDDQHPDVDAPAPITPPTKRVVGRPFRPGQPSPNPNGRPRSDARLKVALGKLSLQAVRELGRLLRDEKTPRRTRAAIAQYLVDRRLGRPATALTGADGAPLIPQPGGGTSDNPLFAMLARLAAQRDAARAEGQPTTTAPATAPPGANGSEPGRPS